MKRHTLKVCSIIRMLISTLQFTTYFFLCCNVFKTVVVNVSFRAGWCDCCMQCLVLFRKVLNVESIRHCAHTLILFHSLCPVLFCSVLQHTKCDGAISSCSDDLHSWLSGVFELLVSTEIRREKFGLCWSFVCRSQAPAKTLISDSSTSPLSEPCLEPWFLSSWAVGRVPRSQEYLRMRVGGYGGQRSIFDQNQICLKTWTAFLAIS